MSKVKYLTINLEEVVISAVCIDAADGHKGDRTRHELRASTTACCACADFVRALGKDGEDGDRDLSNDG